MTLSFLRHRLAPGVPEPIVVKASNEDLNQNEKASNDSISIGDDFILPVALSFFDTGQTNEDNAELGADGKEKDGKEEGPLRATGKEEHFEEEEIEDEEREALRIISLEDDPNMPVNTLRMWVIGE